MKTVLLSHTKPYEDSSISLKWPRYKPHHVDNSNNVTAQTITLSDDVQSLSNQTVNFDNGSNSDLSPYESHMRTSIMIKRRFTRNQNPYMS